MKRKVKKIILISLGGSLIAPRGLDINFLKKFRKRILSHIKRGYRFVIVCGGGETSREHQKAARLLSRPSLQDIDWLGIHGTRLNAHLIRTIFHNVANPKIVTHPYEKIRWKEKVLVAAGWRPGASTDYVSALLAKKLSISRIVNLTNIDYIYDKNPQIFKNARPVESISWSSFRKSFPVYWRPGLHVPFDPVASRFAQKNNIEVSIINGRHIQEFDKYLRGDGFQGTVICD